MQEGTSLCRKALDLFTGRQGKAAEGSNGAYLCSPTNTQTPYRMKYRIMSYVMVLPTETDVRGLTRQL